jgi:hypothetical protein
MSLIQDRNWYGYEYTARRSFALSFPSHLLPPCVYSNEWVSVLATDDGASLVTHREYSTDGCTAVADVSHGATLSRCQAMIADGDVEGALRLCGPLVAHLYHDPLTQFAREMGRAFGWPVWRTIRWANAVFAWAMAECGTPWLQRWAYMIGVEVFGHPFCWFGRQKRDFLKWLKKVTKGTGNMNENGYSIADAERGDRIKAARAAGAVSQDRVTDLLPVAGEDRPMWLMRVIGSLPAWWRKPRSRVGFVLALAGMLAQGCATSGPTVAGAAVGGLAGFVACHNYMVAESERFEKDEVAAGRIPLTKTNGDLMRDNWLVYAGSIGGGAAVGWGVARWAEDRAEGDDVDIHNETTINEAPPIVEPEPEIEATDAGE